MSKLLLTTSLFTSLCMASYLVWTFVNSLLTVILW